MGYLDNSSITVDAVLTKKGREILKDGGAGGSSLTITKFSLTDTGVDYSLWNPDDPSGSAYYGEAIENLPMLEASVHAEYNLRNRLVSLNQKSVALPALTIDNGLDSKNGTTKTFNDGEETAGNVSIRLVGYTSNQNLGLTVLIQDPHVVSLRQEPGAGNGPAPTLISSNISGTGLQRTFLKSEDIPASQEYSISTTVVGSDRVGTIPLNPIQQDEANQQTNIYVVDVETGAYTSFVVVNNITKNPSTLLSSGGQGASVSG